jgi:hypothetical protein
MPAGWLPAGIAATYGPLLSKRPLLFVELMLAFDALVGQFIGLVFHPFPVAGNRIHTFVRRCRVWTFWNIGIRFIRHCSRSQADTMRSSRGADVRLNPRLAQLHQPIRRRYLGIPKTGILYRPLLIAIVDVNQAIALRVSVRPFKVIDQAPGAK